jgi:hypothetical protein
MNETLPDNAGYVAAAYLVFVALLLIYLSITAYRLRNLERELAELTELADDERPVPEPVPEGTSTS